jgi:hypothetical protein
MTMMRRDPSVGRNYAKNQRKRERRKEVAIQRERGYSQQSRYADKDEIQYQNQSYPDQLDLNQHPSAPRFWEPAQLTMNRRYISLALAILFLGILFGLLLAAHGAFHISIF